MVGWGAVCGSARGGGDFEEGEEGGVVGAGNPRFSARRVAGAFGGFGLDSGSGN